MSWSDWLSAEAASREAAGLTRWLVSRPAADDVVDLAGNDYLGLARDPRVREAAAAAALTWGGGAGASRLVTGTLDLHVELEHALASWTGHEACLVLSTGYAANLAVVTGLVGRDCHVVSDAHVHASLVDAARLSRARLTIVPHNDVAAVRAALATSAPGERTLVLAESIYSVLGDEGPLVELAEACGEAGALLVVDEAHGLGVHDAGVVSRLGLAGLPHVLVTATLSKACGSQGGAVLGPATVVEHLVNRARAFIFDTALAPAAAGAALCALGIMRSDPSLGRLVRTRVLDLAAALGVEPPDGAVLSVPMPSPQVAVAARDLALAAGVRVGCFRPPSVPDGISRLRVTVSAGVPPEEWERAVKVLVDVVEEHR
ncbi:8-amino-7-oxononanoate synthase [Nocardioides ginkgobilobae]